MKTHRYQQDTIQGHVWETSIIVNESIITMIETHMTSETGEVIKQIQKIITPAQLAIYQEKNRFFHLETYES
jgi:hypothetical protein